MTDEEAEVLGEKLLIKLSKNPIIAEASMKVVSAIIGEMAEFITEEIGGSALEDATTSELLDELAKRDKVVRVHDISPNHFASMDFTNVNHDKINISGLVAQDVIFYLKEE